MASTTTRLVRREFRSALSVVCRQHPTLQEHASACARASKRRKYTIDARPSPTALLQSLAASHYDVEQPPQRTQQQSSESNQPAATLPHSQDLALNEAPETLSVLADADSVQYDIDYAQEFRPAIAARDSQRIIRSLSAAQHAADKAFLSSITDDEFSCVLDLLQPHNHLGDLYKALLEAKPFMLTHFKLPQSKEVIIQYTATISSIVESRRQSGASLSLQHFRSLLQITKELHHRQLAQRFWHLLHHAGLQPDIECYNGYLGSVIYNQPLSGADRRHEEVSDFTMLHRQRQRLRDAFSAFRTGRGGICDIATGIIEQIKNNGLDPTAETYGLHIRAASLEGNMPLVVDILQAIYHINVFQIKSDRDAQPKEFARDHPLYPTSSLVLEVVRAYCRNYDIHTALKLASYMDRHYGMGVTEDVWFELVNSAHLLSSGNVSSRLAQRVANKVTHETVEALWNTMTSARYNLFPSAKIANELMRTAYLHYNSIKMLDIMERYRQRYLNEIIPQRRAAWQTLVAVRSSQMRFTSQDGDLVKLNLPSLPQAIHDYDAALLRFYTERKYLMAWLRYVLSRAYNGHNVGTRDYDTVIIPRLLENWRFLGEPKAVYTMSTGIVELDLSSEWSMGNGQSEPRSLQRRWEDKMGERMLRLDGSLPLPA